MDYIGYFVYPFHEKYGGAEVRAVEFENEFNLYAEKNDINIRIVRIHNENDLENIKAVIIYGAHYKNYPFFQYIKERTDLKIILSSVFVQNTNILIYNLFSRIKRPQSTIRITSQMLKTADYVFTNTNTEKASLRKAFGIKSDLYNLPNMINSNSIDFFKNENFNLEEIRIDKINKSYICVGRIEPLKNQIKIINSLIKYKFKGHVVFVGRKNAEYKDYTAQFEKLISEYPETFTYVKFMEKPSLIKSMFNSKGLIFPSLFETTGRTALEAAVVGIPMAVSNLPTVKEYLKDVKGVTYFNPKSEKSIYRAIDSMPENMIVNNKKDDFFFIYENGLETYVNFFEKHILAC
ncbi:glycosyltransferase [Thalassobacillus devorans]|uniref:glycosyltransferase n=1 Tax=Thalassobacillus devorans TaxID=279813 RepID=UPI000A1C8F7F|nr:glycosyltransferase [Thalassobacillus devorans]